METTVNSDGYRVITAYNGQQNARILQKSTTQDIVSVTCVRTGLLR